ncbi:OmpA family protein [Flavobacterium sp. XGLA_31]|uniref:OmpA family protein n=1 Tax=Flavobacterium sp. XGLA_31 TaxID=3447666 RepID=UPI003F301C9A
MKNIYLTLGLLLLSSVIYSQDKASEKADKLFDSYQYMNAIEEYTKLVENNKANTHVYQQLADSYYNIFNNEKAAQFYAKAITGKTTPETYFRYAQSLRALGKYAEANKQMDAFAAMMPNDSRAKEHKANPNYIPSLVDKSKLFDVADTNIKNDGQSDFGAVLTNDNTLYFASNRNKGAKNDKWINQPYLDIFKATRNTDGTFSEPTAVNELNTPFHDGPVTISSNGNTMFFARDGLSEGISEKIKNSNIKLGQQRLYKAVNSNGKWTNIEGLPFNSTSYSVTNPSLSKDGKTLYFASNMPGGFGESDIWKVSVEANGYGKPENLGPKVNTAGKESFPFIDENNVLYFSSMGKQGLGGFDVFKIDLNGNEEAQNIGKPLNSEKDDFGFSFNQKQNVGYFSSNRKGSDAIYSATPICIAKATVVVTDKKKGTVINEASVTILDTKGNAITTKQTNAEGKISFDVDCKKGYNFQVTAKNYETATFSEVTKSGETVIPAELVPTSVIITDTEVILNPIYFEFDKSNITAQGAVELDKLVQVMNDNPKFVIFVKSHTDSKGTMEYNFNLSDKRAQSTVQYIISKGIAKERISGKGFGSSEPKVKCHGKCTDEEDAQNRRSEFLIVKK